LQDWADQGVFLLNSILTTTYQISAAHKNWKWQKFTGLTLQHISTLPQPIVFMAWGQYAGTLIDDHLYPETSGPRLVLNACHPQAENFSGGKLKFVGCDHFVKANFFQTSLGESSIKWV
jgi:uracil-DNA glycosylase